MKDSGRRRSEVSYLLLFAVNNGKDILNSPGDDSTKLKRRGLGGGEAERT